MRLHKANSLHLYLAALYLAQSDRDEMDRMEPGRDPQEVLSVSSGDPTLRAISDDLGNVLAVGGSSNGVIWFVHTTHAEALSPRDKLRMLQLLRKHLDTIKAEALSVRPNSDFHFTNVVSFANRKHLNLLETLGANWGPFAFSKAGHEFRQFFF